MSPDERKQAVSLKNAGFSDREIVDLIKNNREQEASDNDGVLFGNNSLGSRFKSGVREATIGVAEDFADRAERRGSAAAIKRLPLSILAGAGRGVGEAGFGIAETLDDITGEVASTALAPVGEEIVNSKLIQAAGATIESLDAATDGGATDMLDVLNLTGVYGVARTLPATAIKQSLKNSGRTVVDTTKKVKTNISESKSLSDFITPRGGAVEKARLQFSDIDPQVETVLKSSTSDEVNQHFQFAQNAKNDVTKSTPLEIVGNKAEEAFKLNKESITKASDAKKAILAKSGDIKIDGAKLAAVRQESLTTIAEKFGVDLTDISDIKKAEGRFSQLDAPDAKLLNDYFTKLDSLGDTPSLREIDDFVDWAQGQLYKQGTSFSKLEVANDALTSQLKQTTGAINGALKDGVGNGYSKVNERIKGLLELNDEINAGLGADARKGGGFVKRLFSPAGGNTRKVFADIKKETGIDLAKEATLAKFAMETVGDSRQKSLLQQLNVVAKETNQLDLAKPGTWLNFLRENADLDGQQLANAIIRAQKANEK